MDRDIVIGDILVCIDNQHRENELTISKEYKVSLYNSDGYVGIIDDYGELYHYRLNRFKLDISYERRFKLLRLDEVVSSRSRL